MKELFNGIAKYYDLLYEDKETKSEVLYLDCLLKEYGKEINSILEFGMGTGRHAKELISLGYEVNGIERSKDMSTYLENIDELKYIIGDIDNIYFHRKYDAVLSLFHVISYQTSNKKILKVFKNAGNHLNKGGVFIFDIWYSAAVNEIKPTVRVKRFSNDNVNITRIAEPVVFSNLNRVDVNYDFFIEDKNTNEIINFKEVHPMRHFSIPEIELYASLSGFKCLHYEQWLTKENPSPETWGVCFVLMKE